MCQAPSTDVAQQTWYMGVPSQLLTSSYSKLPCTLQSFEIMDMQNLSQLATAAHLNVDFCLFIAAVDEAAKADEVVVRVATAFQKNDIADEFDLIGVEQDCIFCPLT